MLHGNVLLAGFDMFNTDSNLAIDNTSLRIAVQGKSAAELRDIVTGGGQVAPFSGATNDECDAYRDAAMTEIFARRRVERAA